MAAVEDRAGRPDEGVAVLGNDLVEGAPAQGVDAGGEPEGGAGVGRSGHVGEVGPRIHPHRARRRGGGAVEQRAVPAHPRRWARRMCAGPGGGALSAAADQQRCRQREGGQGRGRDRRPQRRKLRARIEKVLALPRRSPTRCQTAD